MESVQSDLIVIDGDGEEFMNEVFAISTIGEILTTRPGCMVAVAISPKFLRLFVGTCSLKR